MIDYMADPKEVAKHPDAIATFQEIANGDQRVFSLLWSMWNFTHVMDDLVDNSGWSEEKKEQSWKAMEGFITDLLLNPFVLAHNHQLRALFTSAIVSNIGGDAMLKDPKRKHLSAAARCRDVDVFVHIAGLHRGWDFMVDMSKRRDYDTDEETAITINQENK